MITQNKGGLFFPMDDTKKIRDNIIEAVLPEIVFDGWTWEVVQTASEKAGYDRDMAEAVFPEKLGEAVEHFSDWADRRMMAAMEEFDKEDMRIRDRISEAVMARMEVLAPHKEAVKLALSYWAVPPRGLRASKTLWRTADVIWDWAGDTSTDYNYYTKRGLLSGVLSSTVLFWLNEEGSDLQSTRDFLGRRIENVMQLGRVLGKIKKAG
jgi:ubiquinone biosynthesis protein COQ9